MTTQSLATQVDMYAALWPNFHAANPHTSLASWIAGVGDNVYDETPGNHATRMAAADRVEAKLKEML